MEMPPTPQLVNAGQRHLVSIPFGELLLERLLRLQSTSDDRQEALGSLFVGIRQFQSGFR